MFQPHFARVDPSIEDPDRTLRYVAEMINAPHEPKAIEETVKTIRLVRHLPEINILRETIVTAAHFFICKWLSNPGEYRTVPVSIGGKVKDHWQVTMQMHDLHPYTINTPKDLQEWYRLFQEIHPFEDGNGRVGGALIAGASMALWGYYLIPRGI